MNRVSQVIGVAIGMLGLYAIWMVLPMLPSLVSSPFLFTWGLVALWLFIGATLLLVAYGAVIRQSERDFKILTFISVFLILMYTDNLATPLLEHWGFVENPRHIRKLVGLLSVVLSIVAYQVLKRTTWKKSVT